VGRYRQGQVRTSTAKTRRRSSAQVERDERERADVLGAVGELGAEAACEWTAGAGARLGTTLVAPGGDRREHAVIGELMGAWRGNECRQPLDESQRIEGDGRRAVTPAPFEAVDDAPVGGEHETPRRDRRSSHG